MDRITVNLDQRLALELFLFLNNHADELPGLAQALTEPLRSFLYERLSIEDMERPYELLARLGQETRPDRAP